MGLIRQAVFLRRSPVHSYQPLTGTTARPASRPQKRLSEPVIYTVRPGDSLAAISYRYYGETLKYREIFAANQDKLTSPDKIRIGQKLTIPAL